MQAMRVARGARRPLAARLRCLSTTPHRALEATVSNTHGAESNTSAKASATPIPLSNVEAQWERLSSEEQMAVHEQLEQLQKKDWKQLSIDEKKAAYYVSFGPHGPRTPVNPPGTAVKVIFGLTTCIGVAALMFYGFRHIAGPPPKTMTKEWQEATNERMKEQKANPISGISSEGYKGKGFVTEK